MSTRLQRPLILAALLVVLGNQPPVRGCWKLYDQRSITRLAPIIVLGEIVQIDVARAQERTSKPPRYLDKAHIKIEKVYKNQLTDVKVAEKGEILALMHSSNATVPGSETPNGSALSYRVSTDLRYPVGTRAVWFLFLQSDGEFHINCHPQQCLIPKPGEPWPTGEAYRTIDRPLSRKEWVSQDRSTMNRRTADRKATEQ